MAVANTFTFGSISSSTYGVVVEGSGDYSAPKRDVEMIEIPGRNGSFALDRGRFENITVEYDCVIQNTTQATFEASVASFRNAIVSQKGYQRLTDTYHPNEYRMAVYAGGFDEAPAFHGKGAVFKVKFNCKPQRYLTSGETAVTVANNGTMTNPTLFDSSPLLEVKGYGNVNVNGSDITLTNEVVGSVELLASYSGSESSWDIPLSALKLVDNGDTITLNNFSKGFTLSPSTWGSSHKKLEITSATFSSHNISNYISYTTEQVNDKQPRIVFNYGEQTFTRTGTSTTQTAVDSVTINLKLTMSDNTTYTGTYSIDIRVLFANYDANYRRLALDFNGNSGTLSGSSLVLRISSVNKIQLNATRSSLVANSTQSVLGNPTYIDCDLGEAYKMDDTTLVPLNAYIDLGSDLPKLASGSNTITFDNTITDLQITPRWWKV